MGFVAVRSPRADVRRSASPGHRAVCSTTRPVTRSSSSSRPSLAAGYARNERRAITGRLTRQPPPLHSSDASAIRRPLAASRLHAPVGGPDRLGLRLAHDARGVAVHSDHLSRREPAGRCAARVGRCPRRDHLRPRRRRLGRPPAPPPDHDRRRHRARAADGVDTDRRGRGRAAHRAALYRRVSRGHPDDVLRRGVPVVPAVARREGGSRRGEQQARGDGVRRRVRRVRHRRLAGAARHGAGRDPRRCRLVRLLCRVAVDNPP